MKKSVTFLAVICVLVAVTASAQNKIQNTSGGKPKVAISQKPLATSTAINAARKPGGGGGDIVLPDSDGDGVTDQFDQEQTPPGCPVDSHGVSRDTDGDGVPDCRDKELVTPTVCQPVDADGVGNCSSITVTDSDGDGVMDQLDLEQTPPGCPVDAHGISRDTDGDGVPDCRDKELVTPTVCQPVDADGVGKCPCPENCAPSVATSSAVPSSTLHNELHRQEVINKQQEEEIHILRKKLETLTALVNSFSIAIAEEEAGNALRVLSMPNPARQFFTIRTQSGSALPISIKVLDASGKLIEERSGVNANEAIQIGENYRSGLYLVDVQQGNKKATLRLIKQAN